MLDRVSVIVPSYNSSVTVLRTLDSLFRQSRPYLLKEIIVVDSSDDQKTIPVIDAVRHGKLRIIHLPERTTPGLARNIGSGEASGELLAFIDSDAYAAEDWLENIVAVFDRGYHVGGGRISLPPEQWESGLSVSQYFLQFSEFMGGGMRPVRFTPSCNLFCGKELFHAVGGFPAIRAAEDVIFGLRIAHKVRFHFFPEIQVYHIFTDSWNRYRSNQMLLGEYTLGYLKLESAGYIYRGFLPLLIVPGYFMVKFTRVHRRVLKYGDKSSRAKYWRRLPLIGMGLIFLTAGFLSGCFKKWKY